MKPLRLLLGLPLASLIACGAHAAPQARSAATRRAQPKDLFEPFQCEVPPPGVEDATAFDRSARAEALHLPGNPEYVRFERYRGPTHHSTIAAKGEPCPEPTTADACRAKLAELEAAGRARPQVYAIAIQSGEPTLYEGEAVLSLVGPIDTPERAWLALMVRESVDTYTCDDARESGQRAIAGGFELATLWTKSTCRPLQRVRATYEVTRSGEVTRLREVVVEHDAKRCIASEAAVRGETAEPAPKQRGVR